MSMLRERGGWRRSTRADFLEAMKIRTRVVLLLGLFALAWVVSCGAWRQVQAIALNDA